MGVIKRSALIAAITLVLALAGACGGNDSGSSSDSTPEPTSTGTSTAVQPTPGPFIPSSAGQFLLDGASEEVSEGSQYSYTIIVTMPTGNTAETTFTLDPEVIDLSSMEASGMEGVPLHGFQTSHEASSEGIEWSYEYAIPTDSLPEDALTADIDGQPGWLLAAVKGLLEPRHAYAAGDDGVKIVAQGVLKEFTKEGISQIEEHLGSEDSPVTEGVDSAMNVAEALDRSAEYQKMKQKLAALRDCAENPTNPLTIKQYQEDPAAKQKLLDEVSEVETETKMDMAVRFIGALNSQASGLAGAKWLGFIVGPATSWADAQIARLSQERIDQLEKRVPPCDEYPAFAGTYPEPYGNHAGLPVGGVACTTDPRGKWAVVSFGNPSLTVSEKNLLDTMNNPSYRNFVTVMTLGEPVGLTSETFFSGVYEIEPGPTPMMKLTASNPHNDYAVFATPEFELFKLKTRPDICGDQD